MKEQLLTLEQIYTQSIYKYPGNTAFSLYQGEKVTYAEFHEKVEQVRQELLAAGLHKGDKAALLGTSMPNWNVCYFAAVTLGIVIVPILPDFSPNAIDAIIEHSESKALFASDKLYAKVSKETRDKLDIIIRLVNLKAVGGKTFRTDMPAAERTVPQPEDLAAIIYTSGTTSAPKGVMLSHKALSTQLHMLQTLVQLRQEDIFLSVLPLSHTYECSLGMLFPFMWGASVVYLGLPPTPASMLPALKDVRPTFMLTVPLIMEKYIRGRCLHGLQKPKS